MAATAMSADVVASATTTRAVTTSVVVMSLGALRMPRTTAVTSEDLPVSA